MDALLKKVQNIAAGVTEDTSQTQASTQVQPTPQRPPPPRPPPPQGEGNNRSINLKTASREELVSFIKDYSAYTRQIEARCKKLHEAHTTVTNEKASLQAEYDALSQQNIEQSRIFSAQLKEMEAEVQRVTRGCVDVAAALEDEAQSLKTGPSEIAGVQAAETVEKYAKMLRDLADSQKTVPVPSASVPFYSSMFKAIDALREANESNKRAVLDLRNYTATIPTNFASKSHADDGSSSATAGGKQGSSLPADIELFRVKEENEALRRARDVLQTQVNKMVEDADKMMKKQHELEQQNASLIAAIEQQSSDAEEQKALSSAIEGAQHTSDVPVAVATAENGSAEGAKQEDKQRTQEMEAELEKSRADNEKLKAKITKLQQLLQKAKEQFDIKSSALLESASQIAKLTNEVSSLRATTDDLHAKLSEESDAREEAENAIRAIRHDSIVEREALESRARAAESELAQTQEQFRIYKERARSAMLNETTPSEPEEKPASEQQSYDALDFLQLRSENEKLQQELTLVRGKLNSLQREYNSFKEESDKRDAEHASKLTILQEEKNTLEVQNKRALSELEAEYSLKYEELRRALLEHRESSKRLLSDKDAAISSLQNQIVQLNRSLAESKHHTPVSIVKQEQQQQQPSGTGASGTDHQQQQQQQPQHQTTPSASAVAGAATPNHQVLFHVANMQARRESELIELKKRVNALEEDNAELAKTVELHELQEKELKAQIRDLDRSKSRETVNVEYLKNIIVKYIETDDYEHLMPVISMLLRLTPEEVSHAQQARQARISAGSSRGILSIFPVSPKK